MAIALTEDTKAELVASIQRYFLEERDEEIGELQASFFLEFVLKEVGPSIYNRGVKDAQASLQGTVADLDTALYEPEFGYTGDRITRRNTRGRAGK